jgi:hypothetical protein
MLASPEGARHALEPHTIYRVWYVRHTPKPARRNQAEASDLPDLRRAFVEYRAAGPTNASPRQVFECRVCGSRVVLPPIID